MSGARRWAATATGEHKLRKGIFYWWCDCGEMIVQGGWQERNDAERGFRLHLRAVDATDNRPSPVEP